MDYLSFFSTSLDSKPCIVYGFSEHRDLLIYHHAVYSHLTLVMVLLEVMKSLSENDCELSAQ